MGYVFGEGVREPLRVRAGWVPDETIKELEAFRSRLPLCVRCRCRPSGVKPHDRHTGRADAATIGR